jgi:hypothetical protein
MSIQTILNWYAYAGYPNWRHGALHFVNALEETGCSSAEARDLLIDLYIMHLDNIIRSWA